MNVTAIAPTLDAGTDAQASSIRVWLARKTIENWAKAVDRFRDWEREEIICKDPSPGALAKHREEGAWFIRWTRQLQSMVADPEFLLPEYKATVAGRLSQLEEAFAMIHDPMSDAQADAILKQAFPDASRTGQAD
jgi:hypothetical protein